MEVQKEISSEVDFDAKLLDGGKVELTLAYQGKMGGVKIVGDTDLVKVVDKITDLIPGEWDDALIDNAVAKLLAKKSNA